MPISAARLQRDIEAIARATTVGLAGANRPTFSVAWRAARDYVIAQAEQIGCHWHVDPAGNVHIRPGQILLDEQVWLSGSHLDSVPGGGNFDGVVGVVAPLEVLRAAHEDGRPDLLLELVVFAEEEGTTFGLGMLGSRAWAGTLSAEQLATVRNSDGQNYLVAGAPHGVIGANIAEDGLYASDYRGFIELHIEQGPALWSRGQALALVTAINGRRQYAAEVRGTANHAGSTSMSDRRDALAAAAEMIAALERVMPALAPQAVATVGQIVCRPHAINVIPAEVEFSIDFRAPASELLARGDAQIRECFREVLSRRGLTGSLVENEALPAVAMDLKVLDVLRQAAARIGHQPLPETTSGALHDAAILAPLVPTAMLFVASKDGISHNPAEFSRIEDIALAAHILYTAIADDRA
jgi:hydantoinase/carbamoylase family amidase